MEIHAEHLLVEVGRRRSQPMKLPRYRKEKDSLTAGWVEDLSLRVTRDRPSRKVVSDCRRREVSAPRLS